MQKIGETSFGGIAFGLHALANPLFMNHFVEHGQEALTLPRGMPSIEALHPNVPRFFRVKDLFNFCEVQAQGSGGECCTQ